MNTNVNLAAPVGALAFLGIGFVFVVALLGLVGSLLARKFRFARIVLIGMLFVAGGYLALMLGFSLASQERTLAQGEEKHFCEIDCHLAYSVANVSQSKTFAQSTAQGLYTVVTIKTRFDETTIAPWRGNGLLYPNSRIFTLFDDRGNRYAPTSQSGSPLTAPLRPGESYTTDIAFDLPPDTKPTVLLINEGEWETHFVIGHENSPLHRKTKFLVEFTPSFIRAVDHTPMGGNHIVARRDQ